MEQYFSCQNGHRWGITSKRPLPGNPTDCCPVCAAEGHLVAANPTPSSQPANEARETKRPSPKGPVLEETLDLISPISPPSNAQPPTTPNPPAQEITLDLPASTDQAVTLDAPHTKPASGPLDQTHDVPAPRFGLAESTGGPPVPSKLLEGMLRDRGKASTEVEGYEILGELGRGGMGMVYKARQAGLNRLVALKMIRAGVHANPMDLYRFQREAEAVAQLRHPNIVQIFEVGDANGIPFFSLEYVEGGSLQQQLDGKARPPRPTAALVATLARAMDFAHKQGIIHRDLKPANILLTADGAPKITDFGLAKKLEESEVGQTGTGAILGTPTYMAPEQAKGKHRLIGPPADIYALGAILYDLLTGRPPFKGETIMDTLMMVQNVEPVPPTRLQPHVPRDLETICLKCLQKEPARRYGTALELAEDLDSFTNGRPIKARKVSAAERSWMWAKRRPAAAALVLVSLLALLALGAGGWVFAQREADRALVAELLKIDAVEARDLAVQEQKRAETNLYRAFDSGDQLFLRISQEALLNQPAMEQVRRDLLLRSLAFYQGFLQDYSNNRNVLYDLGRAQRRVGGIYEKLDDPRKALTHYGEAERVFERLAKANPGRPEYLHDEARARIDRAIVLHQLERFDEAEKEHDRAASILDNLIVQAGPVPDYLGDLAASHISRAALLHLSKRNEDAIAYYKRAVSLLEGLTPISDDAAVRVKLAGALNNLGILIHPSDRLAARGLYERVLTTLEAEPKEASHAAQFQRELARAHLNLGAGYRQENKNPQAESEYNRADAILQLLTKRFPFTAEYQHLHALTQKNLGELYAALRQPEKERAADTLAYTLLKALYQNSPNNPTYAADLARVATELGFALGPTREPKKVLELWEEAASLWKGLFAKHPNEPGFLVAQGKCLLNRGQLYGREGKTANALREYEKAIGLYKTLGSKFPAEKGHRVDWIAAHDNQARTYTFLAKGPNAEAAWKAATELGKKWSQEAPDALPVRVAYANALVVWGLETINRGNISRGCDLLEMALPERSAVASLQADRLDRRLDWHKLALLVLERRTESQEYSKVYQVASGWLANWKKMKPLKGEDVDGTYCARAAGWVGKSMGFVPREKEQLRKEYGDLVLTLLRRAVESGYRDRAVLEGSADWKEVRPRRDFAALLKSIDERQPRKGD
jgi:tetratricopeptide (TPR) repeat protein